MIIKAKRLQAFLDKHGITRAEFARRLCVDVGEVDKMLTGEDIGYETSKSFVRYMKADRAQRLIDWSGFNMENPFVEPNDDDDDYIAPEEDDEYDEPLHPEELLPVGNGIPVYQYGQYIGNCSIYKEGEEE